MKPGNSLRAVAFLVFTMLVMSETMNAQDTIPRRDTSRRRTDTTTMKEPISAAPAPMTVVDLNTGAPVEIYYDTVRYMTINKATRQPVDFYVINNVDTVHGMTGLIVNNMLVRPAGGGKIRLDERKVKLVGDELMILSPQGRHVYWTPQGLQVVDFGLQGEMRGEMEQRDTSMRRGEIKQKQKGTEKKGKMKSEWGTIKWKNEDWKYEPSSKGRM